MSVRRTYNFDKMADAHDKIIPEMLNDIAAVIQKDIVDGVSNRRNLDNTRTRPLEVETIKAKRRQGYDAPDLPRVATSTMSGALGHGGPFIAERAKKGSNKAVLRTPASAPYGIYQQDTRPWWGIAPRTQPSVNKIIKVKSIQMVKSAHTGSLK